MDSDLTREYSKRLGTLSGAQLQAALARFGLGDVLGAAPAPGGLFGQNVFITATSGQWVLRGCPHYDGQFEKEAYFCRVIHEQTPASAPWPVLIEKSTEVFGWSYAVMPRLPGVNVLDPDVRRTLTTEDRAGIAAALGSYLPLIQRAVFERPGEYDYDADDIAPIQDPFADWFIGQMRARLTECRKYAETSDGDVEWVESIISGGYEAAAQPFVPTLVHTDYAEGNVVAERSSDGWEIGGVFDLGGAYAGDGEYDLARLACWYGRMPPSLLHTFCAPYFKSRPPRPGLAERLALYIVADRLIFWEYGHRNKVWFNPVDHPSFRDWAEPFVELAAAADRC